MKALNPSQFPWEHNECISMCVSSDGSRVFAGLPGNTIIIWDVASGAIVRTLQGRIPRFVDSLPVNCLCLSPCGTRLFSGSHDNEIRIWDVETGACLKTLRYYVASEKEYAEPLALCYYKHPEVEHVYVVSAQKHIHELNLRANDDADSLHAALSAGSA